MTILLDLIIVRIGNVIIADMNGKFLYVKEQRDINVQNVTINCSNKNNNSLFYFQKAKIRNAVVK